MHVWESDLSYPQFSLCYPRNILTITSQQKKSPTALYFYHERWVWKHSSNANMLPHPFHSLETVEEHPNEDENNNTLRRGSSFVYRRREFDDEASLKNIEAFVAQTADKIPCLSPLDSDSWEDFDYRDELVDNNTDIMENLTLADQEDTSSKRGRTSSTNSLLEEYHTLFAMGESLPHPLSSANDDKNTSTATVDANEALKEKEKKKTCKRHRRTSTHVDFDQVFQAL